MAIPYKITSNYTISQPIITYSERPKICMNILSRSNRIPQGQFQTIHTLDELIQYFPDNNPHHTLKVAKTILAGGYNIYMQNVYKADGQIGARVHNMKDRIVTTPITNDITDSAFELTNFTKSVIHVDLSKAQAGDWFILEPRAASDASSNTLIWFHDKTQEEIDNYVDVAGNTGEYYFIQDYLGISLQYIHFAEGYGISMRDVSKSQRFKELINKSTLGFECFYGSSTLDFYIATNLGFINIGNHTPNITMTMEDWYMSYIAALTQGNTKVFDIQSQWATDNNEISVHVTKIKDYMYKVVVGLMHDDKSIITETHIGSTSQAMIYNEKAPSLIESLSQSTLVTVSTYADDFLLPEGYLYLTKFGNENDEFYQKKILKDEVFMFVSAINNMSNDTSAFHIYYDSDFDSLRYQKALYNKFKDLHCLGIFTFRGIPITNTPTNLAYFSNQTITVNDTEYACSELLIYLLSSQSRVVDIVPDATHATPYHYDKTGVNYVNDDSIITGFRLRGYTHGVLKDLRYCMIEPILLKTIYAEGETTFKSIQRAIKKTKDIFSEMFSVEVYIEMDEFKALSQNEIGVKISYGASFESYTDVDEINLSLEIS